MSQNQAGQTESKIDLLTEITNKIDAIEKQYSTHYVSINKDIEEILGLDYTALEKLTSDECTRYLYIISQYNIVIQRCLNKARATKSYLQAKLDIFIAREYKNYHAPFIPQDIIKNAIIAQDSYANKVFALIQEQILIVESLYDITNHTLRMAKTFENIIYRRKNYGSD